MAILQVAEEEEESNSGLAPRINHQLPPVRSSCRPSWPGLANAMDRDQKESLLRQLTEAFGNRKYFLMSAAVTFFLMLAALVTASNHLSSVRVHAAENKRRSALSARTRLKLLGYGKDNHHLGISVPHILLPGAISNSDEQTGRSWCHHPDCVWVEKYMKGKLEPSVKPCEDFYNHVCSPKWKATNLPFSQRSYRELSIGATIQDLHTFFNYSSRKHFEGELYDKFMHQVSSLYMDCTIDYKGRNEKESLLEFMREFQLMSSNNTSNMSALVGFLDREIRLFPLVTLALTPNTYNVIITSSSTLLKRYLIAFESRTLEHYISNVARSLGLVKPGLKVRTFAEEIVAFEMNLESSYSGDRRANITPETTSNSSEESLGSPWNWDVYMRTVLRDTKSNVPDISILSIKPPDLFKRLSRLLNSTHPNTVMNYLRYRFVVFASPFLSEDFGFLLPLSYESYQENVNERLQACAHSVEGIYPYAMRFFVSAAMKDRMPAHTWEEHRNAIEELVTVCKSSLKEHLGSKGWMAPEDLNLTYNQIDSMKVVLDYAVEHELVGILHYYSRLAVPLRSSSPLQSFFTLQRSSSELYWASSDSSIDQDTRIALSSLVPGYQYVPHTNTLYISPATLGFLGNVHRSTMFLIPSVLPFVIRGLQAPVYSPNSSQRQRQTSKLIAENKLCLFEKYYAGMTDISKEDVAMDIEAENFVEHSTVVKVLYKVFLIYKNLTTSVTQSVGASKSDNKTDFSMDQLFLSTWASTQCQATSVMHEKRLIQHNIVPPRLRVDISLQNFDMFSKVFACPNDSPMSLGSKCQQL
ncbi:uncharacterized protein LOC135400026 [Ornithodoros turicata]|uniref:uncharacterized protein LOC135400026 n=1 Tax=Ornithodoros turicata TaxID=34597 RepID=UPI00313986EB